jgi:hypothetical protein
MAIYSGTRGFTLSSSGANKDRSCPVCLLQNRHVANGGRHRGSTSIAPPPPLATGGALGSSSSSTMIICTQPDTTFALGTGASGLAQSTGQAAAAGRAKPEKKGTKCPILGERHGTGSTREGKGASTTLKDKSVIRFWVFFISGLGCRRTDVDDHVGRPRSEPQHPLLDVAQLLHIAAVGAYSSRNYW